MATKVLTDPQHYTNIANAIREKNGSSNTYTPADMAGAISAIETGGGGSSGIKSTVIIGTDHYATSTLNIFSFLEVEQDA